MDSVTLSALAGFPAQLEAHYDAVPAGYKAWTPPSWDGIPSERLSAIEQICHVRDIEVEGYHVRIRRILSEEHPVLDSLDSEHLAHARSYVQANIPDVFAAIRDARAGTLAMLSEMTPAMLARTAEFSGYGSISLRSLAHFLCSHDQQHLAGIQWLIGQIEAIPGRST